MGALDGLTILVTRPEDRARKLRESLEAHGAAVSVEPAIEVLPVIVALMEALHEHRYDWVVVPSAGAAIALRQARDRLSSPAIPPCAAVGPATAAGLRGDGFEVRFQPDVATGDALAAGLAAHTALEGKRVLYPRSNVARREPIQRLRDAGATVDDVEAYHTVPLKPATEAVNRSDLVLFASPSAVAGYLRGESEQRRDLPAIAIGPTTAEAVTDAGLTLVGTADPHTSEGLVQAVLDWAARR